MVKFPHVFIIKLTDDQQQYLNQFAIHGGRNSYVRSLIDKEIRMESARGLGLSLREMNTLLSEQK